MKGVAFCPAHITGFFKADVEFERKNVENLGSLGAGFSIQEGVKSSVEISNSDKSSFEITNLGYKPDNTAVSEFVVNEFAKLYEPKKFCTVSAVFLRK